MEAPKGREIKAEAGNMEATCRTELRLESKDGEVGERRTGLQRDAATTSQPFPTLIVPPFATAVDPTLSQ